jgi:hypothetical protein
MKKGRRRYAVEIRRYAEGETSPKKKGNKKGEREET